MRARIAFAFGLAMLLTGALMAQSTDLQFPKSVEAGTAFSVPTSGSGAATLYIVGPGDAAQRKVQLGETIDFAADELHNAGHYTAILVGGSSSPSAQFDVIASRQPSSLSFLAKPSRLPVNCPNGISGVVYIFDVFGNLVLQPQDVSFELADANGGTQARLRHEPGWRGLGCDEFGGQGWVSAASGQCRNRSRDARGPGGPRRALRHSHDGSPFLILAACPPAD